LFPLFLTQKQYHGIRLEVCAVLAQTQRSSSVSPERRPAAPQQALEVLSTLHDLTGWSEWLFPGDCNPAKAMSNNTILKALERMGVQGKDDRAWRRGLASTILHELGKPHDHIELQLAHAPRNAVSAAITTPSIWNRVQR
jgi:integrase